MANEVGLNVLAPCSKLPSIVKKLGLSVNAFALAFFILQSSQLTYSMATVLYAEFKIGNNGKLLALIIS